MSRGNTTVSLTLRLHDQASAGLRRMTQEQMAQARQVTDALRQQVAQARDVNAQRVLGIRTEQQIRAELAQVQRAYDHLRTSGRASANDIMRAQAALTEQTRRLNRELGLTEQTQTRLQRLQRAGAVGGAVVGGAMAAGMVLRGPLETARSYDEQLTYLATTVTGQTASMSQYKGNKAALADMVKEALAKGGGTREDAAEALQQLVGSGKYDLSNVRQALSTVTFNASATGARALHAAMLTVQMKEFGIRDGELQRGHDVAAQGGKLGAFEYASQAEHLSKQLPLAKAAGYYGMDGLRRVVRLNQLAMTTASSKDEAGNNVVNFLAKLSSSEFSKSVADAVKVMPGDPTKSDGKKKPKQVFNWDAYAQQQLSQGVYGDEAFMKLLDRQLAGNTAYVRLQAEAKKAKTPEERKAKLEAMSQIAVGSELGQIIADRQALLGIMGSYYNKERGAEIDEGLRKADGVNAADYERVSGEEWFKARDAEQQKLMANAAAYDAVSGSLGTVNGLITEFAQKFPTTTAVLYGGGVAVGALSASAGVASTALWALSRSAGAAGLATGVGAGGAMAGAGAMVKNAGAVGLAGAAGYAVGSVVYNLAPEKGKDELGRSLTELMAALGSENAKAALESRNKYDKMIQQNSQLIELTRKQLNQGPAPVVLDINAVTQRVTQRLDTEAKRGPWTGGYR